MTPARDKETGLRIGKGALGAVASILVAVGSLASAVMGQMSHEVSTLSARVGGLEQEVASIRATHTAEQEGNKRESASIQRQLTEIKDIVEKIRDR